MVGPRYTDIVAGLPATVPFVGPETLQRQMGQPIKARLGANESGFGPSPKVVDAIRAAASDVWMYGDAEALELRSVIAAHHDVGLDSIVLGEGIDGLMGTLVRLVIAPGDTVVTSLGAYPTFAYHVRAQGGVLVEVPFKGDFEDPDALIEAASRTNAKLVYLSNPDNPMGSWHRADRVQAMIDAVPDGCLMLLDEAYIDLAPAGTAPALDMTDPRVIRMRTFSKAHGLAGLRVGYVMAEPALIAAFDKIRNHFGVGRLAQAAALAAMSDRDWLADVTHQIAEARVRLADIATANGLTPLPSATNFVAIDCGRDGDFARGVVKALIARGVFVRMPGVAPLDRCIRVSVGPEPQLEAFAQALPDALKDAAG